MKIEKIENHVEFKYHFDSGSAHTLSSKSHLYLLVTVVDYRHRCFYSHFLSIRTDGGRVEKKDIFCNIENIDSNKRV